MSIPFKFYIGTIRNGARIQQTSETNKSMRGVLFIYSPRPWEVYENSHKGFGDPQRKWAIGEAHGHISTDLVVRFHLPLLCSLEDAISSDALVDWNILIWVWPAPPVWKRYTGGGLKGELTIKTIMMDCEVYGCTPTSIDVWRRSSILTQSRFVLLVFSCNVKIIRCVQRRSVMGTLRAA